MSSQPDTEVNFRRGRKHHFQVHDLPRISQKAALKLLGAESILAAVEELKNKKPAELRVSWALKDCIRSCKHLLGRSKFHLFSYYTGPFRKSVQILYKKPEQALAAAQARRR